jgi:hypothetical protein
MDVTITATNGARYIVKGYTNSNYTTEAPVKSSSTGLPISDYQISPVFNLGYMTAGTTYYIKGFARNDTGTTESSGASQSTSSPPPPPPPVSPTVTVAFSNETQTTATVTVSASGGGTPTFYHIKNYTDTYYTAEASPQFTFTKSGATFSVTGLTQNSLYYVMGFATINGVTVSSTGNTLETTAAPPPFASPNPFTGTSTSATEVLTFNYTATHTRTYTVTATGFDCTLSLNGSGYQDDDNAPSNGETSTIALNAGASLTIKVSGAPGGGFAKFGTITVTIT